MFVKSTGFRFVPSMAWNEVGQPGGHADSFMCQRGLLPLDAFHVEINNQLAAVIGGRVTDGQSLANMEKPPSEISCQQLQHCWRREPLAVFHAGFDRHDITALIFRMATMSAHVVVSDLVQRHELV